MMQDRYSLAYRVYPYQRSADQDRGEAVRHPVVIVGAGPVGIALALDLGLQGIPVLILDDHEGIGTGSRAICFAKRSLEIAERYGCGKPMLDKGVVWNVGKVFHRDDKVFEFNLLPEAGHKYPAFINLQQPYFEKFLFDRLQDVQAKGAPVVLRGRNRVDAIDVNEDHVTLTVMTPDGPYTVEADWLIACDGARSPVRTMLGYSFTGKVFQDSFLIADIRMTGDIKFPVERWFWFEPSHGQGASTLLHRQPDDIWRVDFQIGWDVDRKEELKEENVRRRLDAFLGTVSYDLVWSSIYTFQCKRMEHFRHGRVFFAGDAAHQVSPFGARGANSGVQDADNLGWKLGLVLRKEAPELLLDTYGEEREFGADENILNSTRSTDFITPKSEISKIFRDAVLSLAGKAHFARPLVNSGRLSVPCVYDALSLTGVDALVGGPQRTRPGAPMVDAPVGGTYLSARLGGSFQLLTIDAEAPDSLCVGGIPVARFAVSAEGHPELSERYLGDAKSAVYLFRPDQHVVARWAHFDEGAVRDAVNKATARG